MNNPTILTVFGATGDLMAKKIIPALYSLYEARQLPDKFRVVGFARRDFHGEKFCELIKEDLRKYLKINQVDNTFLELFTYVQGQLDDEIAYQELKTKLAELDEGFNMPSNKLFYYSVAPDFFEVITNNISKLNLNQEEIRLIIEKPFGSDEQSARELDETIKKSFNENNIFRIDHYLGKDILLKIMDFRFKEGKYESIWNNKHIKRIEITTLEDIGVENRGAFYDKLGALKDVGQNHLLEMAALLMMKKPGANDSESIRKARAEAISKLETTIKNTFRAQYKGYKDISEVQKDSSTETYFKINAISNDPSWQRVPIAFEAGKKLAITKKQIEVVFENFKIVFCLHPKQKIVKINLDKSEEVLYESTEVKFEYVDEYALLINKAIKGEKEDFVSMDEVLAEWRFVDPIIKSWRENIVPLEIYESNSNEILVKSHQAII